MAGFGKALNKFTDESVARALKDMGRTPQQREKAAKKQAVALSSIDEIGASFRARILARHAAEMSEWIKSNPVRVRKTASSLASYKDMVDAHKLELDRHDLRWGLKK